MSRITHRERCDIFGPPCTGTFRVRVDTPWGLHTYAHSKIAGHFLAACDLAKSRSSWTPARIDSYNCRPIRGSSSYSLHSWPLAWDFFDRPYPEPVDVWGPTNAPDAAFLSAFRDLGFFLGANFTTRKDYPHIEWAGGEPPALTIKEAMLRVPNAVAACRAHHGGCWVLGSDGGVFAFGDAPFYGSYPSLPLEHRQGERAFVDIERNDRGGYDIFADDGSVYSFPV